MQTRTLGQSALSVTPIGLSNETPWGLCEFIRVAEAHGLPRVASTLVGATTMAQLEACLDAWGTPLAPELLQGIDQIRAEMRDPAQ